MDLQESLQSRPPLQRLRKREVASALFNGFLDSVQSFATDVAQGFEELISPPLVDFPTLEDAKALTPVSELPDGAYEFIPSPEEPPTQRRRTSRALWNL